MQWNAAWYFKDTAFMYDKDVEKYNFPVGISKESEKSCRKSREVFLQMHCFQQFSAQRDEWDVDCKKKSHAFSWLKCKFILEGFICYYWKPFSVRIAGHLLNYCYFILIFSLGWSSPTTQSLWFLIAFHCYVQWCYYRSFYHVWRLRWGLINLLTVKNNRNSYNSKIKKPK